MKKNHYIILTALLLSIGIIFSNSYFSTMKNNSDSKFSGQLSKDVVIIPKTSASSIVADHSIVNLIRLDQIPESAITAAKNLLHIAYGHTSHGSQLISGMNDLPTFKESLGGTEELYNWNDGPEEESLDLDDNFAGGDLGNPDFTTWATLTRDYLENPTYSDVNVIIWSWCGQVSGASEDNIITYLSLMSSLEDDYPDIKFVYMTGHTDGSGLEGNLHIRNEQIRAFCIANDKILYDFADIESYDPDGNYFGDKYVTDSCNYDDGEISGNWAVEWCDAHPGEWYECNSAHSHALNANLKAYAAWYLWARLAGWGQIEAITLAPITPNPSFTGIINLDWTEIVYIDNYTIYRFSAPIYEINESIIEVNTIETSEYTDIVNRNNTFYYVITATNETGTSTISNCVNVTVILQTPQAPELLNISPNPSFDGQIYINWEDVENADNYTIYRSTFPILQYIESLLELGNTESSQFNDSISVEATHYYVVCSANSTGISSVSNCVEVFVDLPGPDAPTLELISPNPSNTGDISLNWSDIQNALFYKVYRSSSYITEINESVSVILQTSISEYSERILTQDDFYYAVTVTTLNGTSNVSNSIHVLIDFSYKNNIVTIGIVAGASTIALAGIGIMIYRKKQR